MWDAKSIYVHKFQVLTRSKYTVPTELRKHTNSITALLCDMFEKKKLKNIHHQVSFNII